MLFVQSDTINIIFLCQVRNSSVTLLSCLKGLLLSLKEVRQVDID